MDRVIQTDPKNIERDVNKAERVVQTDPTKFEEQEKRRHLVLTVKWNQLSEKKPTVESFESMMKNVK